MDLSVITVTHHSKDYIEELVFSTMMSCFKIKFEHIIVDNASKDDTVAHIEERFSKYVTLIKNEKNRGFAHANNQGLAVAKGRYILFLNPDMCIKEGTLDSAVELMDEQKDVGLLTCKLVPPQGKKDVEGHPSDFPKLKEALLWIFGIKKKRLEVPQGENFKGAFLLVRREILETLGWGFDPRYFLLFEDTDLCREVKRLGYRNVYFPEIGCIDYISRSFSIKKPRWIYVQYSKSMFKYFRKWHPWTEWVWLALAIPIGYAFRFIRK